MADLSALLRIFGEYARTIAGPYDMGDVLCRLTGQVTELTCADGAGVSIADDGRLRFVTASDESVATIEEQQARLPDGPCHEACRSRECVVSADLASDDRWPQHRHLALAQGVTAVAGVPLRASDRCLGALNLYRRGRLGWAAEELEVAQVLADMATGYVLNAGTLSAQRDLAAQLQRALDSRVLIEQAKGILAERHGTDTATAFDRLRSHARSTNAKIHDAAAAVVDGTLRL
jgi:GAF domain-containing protein